MNNVCQSCGIKVGTEQMETRTFEVGNYQICGWCLIKLKKWGHIQVEPYVQHIYLYQDGTTTIKTKKAEVVKPQP